LPGRSALSEREGGSGGVGGTGSAPSIVTSPRDRLGVWLRRNGRQDDAAPFLAEASRLHPASWNMWRQAADLDEVGKASGPDFWARVHMLGDRPYYPRPDVAGL
jgi:hypothetical protein